MAPAQSPQPFPVSATPLPIEAPALRIDDLCRRTRSYLSVEQIKQVRQAYRFSAEAHDGQVRKSGEPYIQHPLAVANILADMHMDHETLVAAMLHDVIEDTAIVVDRISDEFGSEVAQIVDGLSKLTQIETESHAEAQAQNFQKMLMAMADDIRVILVKLADRLHNMRTLGALEAEQRRRIARETLEIYAPIAQRLGMNAIRLELEDLGFHALYPLRSQVLRNVVQKIRGNRKEVITKIRNRIKRYLRQEKLVAHVVGREKHLYSIYKKMREKHLHLVEVLLVRQFVITTAAGDEQRSEYEGHCPSGHRVPPPSNRPQRRRSPCRVRASCPVADSAAIAPRLGAGGRPRRRARAPHEQPAARRDERDEHGDDADHEDKPEGVGHGEPAQPEDAGDRAANGKHPDPARERRVAGDGGAEGQEADGDHQGRGEAEALLVGGGPSRGQPDRVTAHAAVSPDLGERL